MVMYIFSVSSKGKGIYFKRRNPYISACSLKRWAYKEIKVYITACSLNIGYTKKLKVYYMNQNLTFNFSPEQMIEWKVACFWNDEKKTWIYAPTFNEQDVIYTLISLYAQRFNEQAVI